VRSRDLREIRRRQARQRRCSPAPLPISISLDGLDPLARMLLRELCRAGSLSGVPAWLAEELTSVGLASIDYRRSGVLTCSEAGRQALLP
jgi:hypothetical protein